MNACTLKLRFIDVRPHIGGVADNAAGKVKAWARSFIRGNHPIDGSLNFSFRTIACINASVGVTANTASDSPSPTLLDKFQAAPSTLLGDIKNVGESRGALPGVVKVSQSTNAIRITTWCRC
jgi:hypothetical protein